MASRRIKLPPTKSSLLKLKQQLEFLQQGHQLLERKRELLTRLVYERVERYRRLKSASQQQLEQAYRWLAIAEMRMGSRALQQLALATGNPLQLQIIPRRSIGVEYPAVSVEHQPEHPLGLFGSDCSFDQAREQLADAVEQLAHLGEARMSLERLMEEQRKAQKRVNALKYNIIPRYRESIAYIESVLEEEERNRLFQIRRLQQRQENRQR